MTENEIMMQKTRASILEIFIGQSPFGEMDKSTEIAAFMPRMRAVRLVGIALTISGLAHPVGNFWSA
jgi:hypothetical protein